jgi:hypothetical protein
MARLSLSSTSLRAIARRCRVGREVTPAAVAIHLAASLLQALCAVAAPRSRYMRSALVAREPLNFNRHMVEMSDRKFQRLYRLSKVDFMELASHLRPLLERKQSRPRGGNPAVETTAMLAVTMRILAGASYLDVGWPYGLADATVYVLFDETLEALGRVLDNISFPTSVDECVRASDNFQRSRQSPLHGIIAALDGISIAIACPREAEDPRKFFNRKGFYSICVQAAVGADYRIYYVSSLHAGSTHDSTAFQSTQLCQLLLKSAEQGGLPNWASIAADDAYGNRGRVLTPYSGRMLTSREDAFNYFLSSCRIFVEQVFGVIVARFGIFWSPMRCSVKKTSRIVVVCCKIHNFIIDRRLERGDDNDTEDLQPDDDNCVAGEPQVHIQDELHMEAEVARHIRHEVGGLRDRLSDRIYELGLRRPPRRNNLA